MGIAWIRRRRCLVPALLAFGGAGLAWGFTPAPPPTFVSPRQAFKPPVPLGVPLSLPSARASREDALLRRLAGPGAEGRSRRELLRSAGVTLVALGERAGCTRVMMSYVAIMCTYRV